MTTDLIVRRKLVCDYWTTKLTGKNKALLPSAQRARRETVTTPVDATVSTKLQAMTKGSPWALLTICATLYRVLLQRYYPDMEPLLVTPNTQGNAEDVLFYTTQLASEDTLRACVGRMKEDIQQTQRHADIDAGSLRQIAVEGGMEPDELFRFGLLIDSFQPSTTLAHRCALLLTVQNTPNGIAFGWQFDTNTFSVAFAEQFARYYLVLVETLLTGADKSVDQITLLSEAETNQLRFGWNNTARPLDPTLTVVAQFEQQVEQTPDAVALVFGDSVMTYAAVNAVANQLARQLLVNGLQPGDRVGVCVQRSAWSVLTLLAIAKAGGVYLFVDQHQPAARRATLLAAAQPVTILTDQQSADALEGVAIPTFCVETMAQSACATTNPTVAIDPTDAAYCIFTSGSTGEPKGVVQTHRTLINLMEWQRTESGIATGQRYLQYASFGFDVSLQDVWFCLCYGGSLHVLPEEDKLSIRAIQNYIAEHQLQTLYMPGSVLNNLFETGLTANFTGQSIRDIITAGEQLLIGPHLSAFLTDNPRVMLHNHYGPTETHVVTTHTMSGQQPLPTKAPIGKPVANTQVYLFNERNQLVPVGMSGDVFIGGANLAQGYLNRPDWTAERFMDHTWPDGTQERLYRTGDLARWQPDGTLEYLGRKDQQVKIRGFRIEPAEIEQVLLRYDGVNDVIVLVQSTDGDTENKYLVAYYTAQPYLNEEALKASVGRLLPDYMVPAYFVKLDQFPLNTNGKIDRKALPDPVSVESVRQAVQYLPQSATEKEVAAIWADILGKSTVGLTDDFFRIGGHSLKATRMIARIYKQFGVEVAIKDFFAKPTVASLAEAIDRGTIQESVAIPVAPVAEAYPLSHAQYRLWLQKQSTDQQQFNMPFTCRLWGHVQADAFALAFRALIDRHEVLRTSIILQDGQPRQRIRSADEIDFAVQLLDWRDRADREERIHDMASAQARQPFDLSNPPLLRISLIRSGEAEYVLVLVMHHIICDGWSVDTLTRELFDFYEAYRTGKPVEVAPLRIHYKDFAVWQNESFQQPSFAEHEQYWLDQFRDECPALEIIPDFSRPAVKQYAGNSVDTILDKSVSDTVRALANSQSVSTYMFLLAAFKTLLFRYSGQTDLVVGSPVAGREHADLHNQLGNYINLLPIRTRFGASDRFVDLLANVRENTLGGYAHQSYPFDKLVGKLEAGKDHSRTPLFSAGFTWHNYATDQTEPDWGFTVGYYDSGLKISQSDIWLHGSEQPTGEIRLALDYDIALFKPERMSRMLTHFVALLQTLSQDIQQPLLTLAYLPTSEREWLQTVGRTADVQPLEPTLVDLFEKQVTLRPGKVAVKDAQESLTYEQLDEHANRLAHYLLTEGSLQPEGRVGVLMGRSVWTIAGLLGIVKAGGAYVPLDPTYPADRLTYMMQDSAVSVLLTDSENMGLALELFSGLIMVVDIQLPTLDQPTTSPAQTTTPSSLSYIMYTSGSTGMPKGVMVEQSGIVRLVHQPQYVSITDSDKLLLSGALAFDATTFEIWGMLLNGGELHVVPTNILIDAQQLKQAIAERGITMMWMTVALFNQLADTDLSLFAGLTQLLVGGDKLSPTHIRNVQTAHPTLQLINGYGPTENTTFSACYTIDNQFADTVPIGAPIDKTSAYILDAAGQFVPIGVQGELYVGGAGLARGYQNQPELTQEKFIDNPYRPGERLYKTGDMARWTNEGIIEFFGRRDNQVKIRGYRIDVGEIEAMLTQHDQVDQAVVLTDETDGEKSLAVYVVSQHALDLYDLKQYLSRKLPPHAIPQRWELLDRMPLTSNGKIDRRALMAIRTEQMPERSYEAPQTELEKGIAAVWANVLSVAQPDVTENFFDAGGHSLKAARLTQQIWQQLELKIELAEVFQYPTIRELATLIGERQAQTFESITTIAPADTYAVSPAQRRMWLLQQMEPESFAYNMAFAYQFDGTLNKDVFEGAWNWLVNRHESLRTVFAEQEDVLVQRIQTVQERKFSVGWESVEHLSEAAVQQRVDEEASHVFKLETGPLLRVTVLTCSENRQVISLVMHHIVSDGWSLGVMFRELVEYYNAGIKGLSIATEPLRIQYKEFAAWQNRRMVSAVMGQHKAYWLNQFASEPPVLQLPTDGQRGPIKGNEGRSQGIEFAPATVQKLKALAQREGMSDYMVLLTTLNLLLNRYTGDTDIVIGCAVAGREHADLEPQIGCYINTLALRTAFEPTWTANQLLQQVKAVTLGAYEHQAYPFEELVEALALQRDTSRPTLFSVMMTLQSAGEGIEQLALDGVEVQRYGIRTESSKFDWDIDIRQMGETMVMSVNYDRNLFSVARMERMVNHFCCLLNDLLDRPEMSLHELQYLTQDEQRQLLTWSENKADESSSEQTLVDILRISCGKYANRVAIQQGEEELTYGELWALSNRVARQLTTYQVSTEEVVGVLIPRSYWTVVGLLGILKSGGAYVPLDMDYPAERIQQLVAEAGIRVVLVDKPGTATRYDLPGITELVVDPAHLNDVDDHDLDYTPSAHQLAYVLYTSGSTGKPKGVEIEHHSLIDYVRTFADYFALTESDVVVHQASLSFDTAVEELFPVWLAGGRVAVAEGGGRDIEGLLTVINQGATVLTTTPLVVAELNQVADQMGDSLRVLISGGDSLNHGQIDKLIERFRIVNTYGPTETTVCVSYEEISSSNQVIGIGRPIRNRALHVMDAAGRPQPVGVWGELWLGGSGVARGYRNRNDLTNKQFIPHPSQPEQRLYRSGDWGRWRDDGRIEFMGRRDNQVKIRGYRVELDEIEQTITRYPTVQNVVVVGRTVGTELCLCAFYEGPAISGNLRNYLTEQLPTYMVPRYLQAVDQLPRTITGKLDRQAIQRLPIDTESTASNDILDSFESALANVWKDVLGGSPVSRSADFFGLGGHSLKATRLVQQVEKQLNLSLSLWEVFRNPMLGAMADLLKNRTKQQHEIIPVAAEQDAYPVSSAQKRMWLLNQLEPDSYTYNMAAAWEISGTMIEPAFEESWQTLVDRHEILRTVLTEAAGELYQRVLTRQQSGFAVEWVDASQLTENDLQAGVLALSKHVFNLAKGPLLRVCVWRVSPERRIVMLVMHHIISDGWSMGILEREIFASYRATATGQTDSRNPLRIQYKDFSVWQQQYLTDDRLASHKHYWLEQLRGPLPQLTLPTEETFETGQPADSARQGIELDSATVQAIQQLAQQESLSDYMVLLVALNLLVYRYTGSQDQLVGCAIAGREHADLDDQLGNYVNTLVLRSWLEATWTVRQLLNHVRQITLDAYSHQRYPFDALMEELGLDRDVNRTSIFAIMLTLQNASHQADEALDGLTVNSYGQAAAGNKFDLDLDVQQLGDRWFITVGYDRNRFGDARIVRLLGHYKTILQHIAQDQTSSLSAVNYLTATEKAQVLDWSEGPALVPPVEETVISLLSKAVPTRSYQLAVSDGQTNWTYGELWQRSNQIAHYLLQQSIAEEERVGILLPRTVWMLGGVLGVLKAGGCYVPLDRTYPAERLQHIIQDAGIRRVLVEQAGIAEALGLSGLDELILSDDTIQHFQETAVPVDVQPEQLAYVLYTSGSTGQPKGVEIEHRNAVAFLTWCLHEFADADYEQALAVTSLNFDLSVYELFYPLLAGKSVRILESGLSLVDYLPTATDQKLLVNTVPSVIDALLQAQVSLRAVRVLNMAGEPIGPYVRKHLPFDQIEVRNLYGPTEDTTYSTCYRIREGRYANRIGRSKQFSQAYVLGMGDQLQPIGVPGEICLSGAGVARGYHNQPELTRQRFELHPFKTEGSLYRTGDLGYWDEDGQLVCIGRKDTQVKLRGYRIELGEIEKKLEAMAGIRQAVLVLQGEGETKQLVAFYEAAYPIQESPAAYLADRLPSWMIPEHFIAVDAFPLTPNGKIDRRILAQMVYAKPEEASDAVVGETETTLKHIWEEELGRQGIGRHDNFFRIGGHSLKAVRLISRIRQQWQIDTPLKTIFLNPTIAQLSKELSRQAIVGTQIPVLSSQEAYDVSPGQLVWLTKYRYARERIAFNMHIQSTILNFNRTAFESSVAVLIERHENLRSRFVWQGNRCLQYITDVSNFNFAPDFFDVRDAEDEYQTVMQLTKARIDQPFDCENGPLIAIQVFRLTDHDYRVVFIIDHVISDAWSLKTLQDDFTSLYDAFCQSATSPLQPLRVQYKDFAAWHRQQLHTQDESKAQSYWRQKLSSVEWGRDLSHVLAEDALQREHSYARYIDAELNQYFKDLEPEQRQQVHGSVFSVRPLRGLSYQSIVQPRIFERLKQLTSDTSTSLFSVLSASIALLMYTYTGRKDVLIGTPVSLRGHQEFDALVGWFLDTLLLHNPVHESATIREVVQLANANNLEAHEHRYYPFERVLQDSDVSLDAIGSVFLHLLNGDDQFSYEGFTPTHRQTGCPTFDINFTFNEYQNCLLLTCDYRDEIFTATHIEQVIQTYLSLLERMGSQPDSRVADVVPRPEGRPERVLVQSN